MHSEKKIRMLTKKGSMSNLEKNTMAGKYSQSILYYKTIV